MGVTVFEKSFRYVFILDKLSIKIGEHTPILDQIYSHSELLSRFAAYYTKRQPHKQLFLADGPRFACFVI